MTSTTYTQAQLDILLAAKAATSSLGTAATQPTTAFDAAGVAATAAAAAQATAVQRANHTGTQTSATISDFSEAAQDAFAALFVDGANISHSYNDASNTFTVTATGTGAGTTDPEVVRDTIGAALVGLGNIAITVNDAADTITIVTSATVNSTDAALRDRSTHTGTQSASTISGLAAVATSGSYNDLTNKPAITGATINDSATSSSSAWSSTKTAALLAQKLPELGAFELQPFWGFGHSWLASDTNATPGTRWHERLVSRLRMKTITNLGLSGRTIGDVATAALTGSNAWVPRTKALVGCVCTINDVTLWGANAATERTGYQHAWRSLLSLLTTDTVVASNTTRFVYSSGWVAETVASSSAQAASTGASGGTRFKATATGAYFQFTFTGTQADVVLVARAAGAGLVTFTEGATTIGTLDLTAATAQDTPAIFKIRGLTAGAHTITGTLTSGASATVDSYRIPLTAPSPIVVLGEPPVTPAGGDISGYVAEVETLKGYLATICAEYPSAVYVDLTTALNSGWNSTMLASNGKHPNDAGCAFIADAVAAALATFPYSLGLNVTAGSFPGAYTVPAGTTIPSGGQDGTGAAGAASATAPGAPGTPTLTGGNAVVTAVTTAPGSTGGAAVTDYVWQRSANSGTTWATVADAVSTALTLTDTTVANGTAYVYRVAAVNSVGTGTYSAASAPITPSASAPTTITDTFNRADAATLGTTSDGTQTWTNIGGTVIGVSSNRAKGVSSTGNGYAYLDAGAGKTLSTVQVTLADTATTPSTMIAGVVLSLTDANYHWVLNTRSSSSVREYCLGRRSAGAPTITATSGVIPAAGDVINIQCLDAGGYQRFVVKVNGTQIIDYTHNAVIAKTTLHGLYANATDTVTAWDDFSITPA